MREIKFRGKSLNGEWLYGYLLKWKDGATYILHSENENEEFFKDEVNPVTVGQFTGLKDKNGVEIYEGDIIQPYQCSSTVCEVVFKRGAFGNMVDFMKSFVPLSHMEELQGDGNVEWVVLGDIHDNPELLKGGNGINKKKIIMNRKQRTHLTPEETQEFIDLGVDFGETADVWLLCSGSEEMLRYTRGEGEYLSKPPTCYTSLLPAPNLQEVLEVLPKNIELDGEEWTLAFALQPEYNNLWTVFYVILGGERYHTESDQQHPNPLIAAIELLRWVSNNHPEALTKTGQR